MKKSFALPPVVETSFHYGAGKIWFPPEAGRRADGFDFARHKFVFRPAP